MHDILNVIMQRRVKPTHIMYKANLSHQMLTEYLVVLIEKGLISELQDKAGRKTYALTEKGYSFLSDYKLIQGFLDSYGLVEE